MSDPTPASDAQPDIPPVPPLPDAPVAGATAPADPSAKRRKLLIGVGAGVVVLFAAAVTGIVIAVNQPTPLERAAEACGGTGAVERLTAQETVNESEEETADDMTPEEIEKTFGKYFEGVVTLEDEGHSLIVATKPDTDDPLGVSAIALTCVQEELGMPTWLTESISTTRALDGRQNGEWENYTAQWGYHPDNGLHLIIVQK